MCIRDSRRTADASGRKGRPDTATYRRESAMAGISTEIKQRAPIITCLLYTSILTQAN